MSDAELQSEMDEAEESLLPCPFCAEYDEITITGEPDAFYVDCPCGCQIGPRNALRFLVHQWNCRVFTRPDDEPANGQN